jgi:hypothetical protein
MMCEDGNKIHLARVMVQCLTFVNTVLKFRVAQMVENFLTS